MSEPIPEVVKLLEDLLNDALSGVLRGVGMVTLTSEYGSNEISVGTCWKGAAGEDLPRLIGGISYLHFRCLQKFENPDLEPE
jgi:hypothetical protein